MIETEFQQSVEKLAREMNIDVPLNMDSQKEWLPFVSVLFQRLKDLENRLSEQEIM